MSKLKEIIYNILIIVIGIFVVTSILSAQTSSTSTSTDISGDACLSLNDILPGCHSMGESPNARFNSAMNSYVIVGTREVISCSTNHISGCSSTASGGSSGSTYYGTSDTTYSSGGGATGGSTGSYGSCSSFIDQNSCAGSSNCQWNQPSGVNAYCSMIYAGSADSCPGFSYSRWANNARYCELNTARLCQQRHPDYLDINNYNAANCDIYIGVQSSSNTTSSSQTQSSQNSDTVNQNTSQNTNTTQSANTNVKEYTWNFSDGNTTRSYIFSRTDQEYSDYVSKIDAECRKIPLKSFRWRSGAGNDNSSNWRNFGVPECAQESGTTTSVIREFSSENSRKEKEFKTDDSRFEAKPEYKIFDEQKTIFAKPSKIIREAKREIARIQRYLRRAEVRAKRLTINISSFLSEWKDAVSVLNSAVSQAEGFIKNKEDEKASDLLSEDFFEDMQKARDYQQTFQMLSNTGRMIKDTKRWIKYANNKIKKIAEEDESFAASLQEIADQVKSELEIVNEAVKNPSENSEDLIESARTIYELKADFESEISVEKENNNSDANSKKDGWFRLLMPSIFFLFK